MSKSKYISYQSVQQCGFNTCYCCMPNITMCLNQVKIIVIDFVCNSVLKFSLMHLLCSVATSMWWSDLYSMGKYFDIRSEYKFD